MKNLDAFNNEIVFYGLGQDRPARLSVDGVTLAGKVRTGCLPWGTYDSTVNR